MEILKAKKEDCLSLEELLIRWEKGIGMLKDELSILLKDQKQLPIYEKMGADKENITLHQLQGVNIQYSQYMGHLVTAIYRYDGRHLESYSKAFIEPIENKIFVRKKNVEKLELEHPEYIDINNVQVIVNPEPEKESSLLAEVKSLKATIKEHSQVAEKKADWRKQYGFLDSIITLLDNGISREELNDILLNGTAQSKLNEYSQAATTKEKADWRKQYGFLNYVIGLIEENKSKEEINKILLNGEHTKFNGKYVKNYAQTVVKTILFKDLEDEKYSRQIAGTITSKDLATLGESGLRDRSRKLSLKNQAEKIDT